MDFNDTSIGPITAGYVGLISLTTLACTTRMLAPLQLYFSLRLITAGQWWRIFSHFFYFGSKFSLEFFLNLIFWVQFSNSLETINFHRRRAGFLYMLMFGSTLLTLCAWLFKLHFMGSSLTVMISYIWARRNQNNVLAWMGIIPFRAPYLPWVIVFFSALSGGDLIADLLGIVVGHIYYFLEDVCPRILQTQYRLLRTPKWLTKLFPNDLRDDDTAFLAAALQADPVLFMQQQNAAQEAQAAQQQAAQQPVFAAGTHGQVLGDAAEANPNIPVGPTPGVPELIDREALERNLRRVNELIAQGALQPVRSHSQARSQHPQSSQVPEDQSATSKPHPLTDSVDATAASSSLSSSSSSSSSVLDRSHVSNSSPAQVEASQPADSSSQMATSSTNSPQLVESVHVENEAELRRRARLEALKRLGSRSQISDQ